MKNFYDNRELSWLKFNERVLDEARDPNVPLGERLNFAAIFQSNLDEFFMIRVGSLCDCVLVGDAAPDNKTGFSAETQLELIYKRCQDLGLMRDAAYFSIAEELENKYDIEQVDFRALSKKEEEFTREYFKKEIMPLLNPQVTDKRYPFPFLQNKAIYAVCQLETKSGTCLGIVAASGNFNRVLSLPYEKKMRYMLAEELILHYMPIIFSNYKILSKSLLRVTRNADINLEEGMYDHDIDYRDIMATLLKERRILRPIRMELSRNLSDAAVDYLKKRLTLTSNGQIFHLNSPLDLSFIYDIKTKIEDKYVDLYYEHYTPQKSAMIEPKKPIIEQILAHDVLLSYPYESIKPFLSLLQEASEDSEVVSLKITLYRVARQSKVVEALINAAENGKDVFVLVELRARFDEENNIGWSKALEKAGCTVMYGPDSIKVHSKLLLITKKTADGVKHITQIGTGNYNEKTSALYTDLSLMTANEEIGVDASYIFNCLATGLLPGQTQFLLASPLNLQSRIIDKIDAQIAASKAGNTGFIGLKLNSLTDKLLIDKLIEASKAGVKIDMAVRGICCLVAGVAGYTENIRVISIVGRFLEHSRIYIFGTGDDCQIYISSADFMTRNTLRRIEVAAPVLDTNIKKRIKRGFSLMFSDNVKARMMRSDGIYYHRPQTPGEQTFSFQDYQMEKAMNAEKLSVKVSPVVKVKPVKVKVKPKKA
ncbi:MAG: polyphosphate kinase 1 [Ruminococcus sp.]|jgi:polyphosphate kinase|nr:polyphosphate kinase 1 [Ruminococcus sp.]